MPEKLFCHKMHKNYNCDTNGANLDVFKTTYTKMSSLSSNTISPVVMQASGLSRQGNVKVRLNPVKKIPLTLFNKEGLKIFPPLKRGLGGILKLKAFHIKIIILDPILI